MRKAFVLIEALVVAAILATLVALLWPAFSAARAAASRQGDRQPEPPPATWLLRSVTHDEHTWVITTTNHPTFVHHPDCPCSGKVER